MYKFPKIPETKRCPHTHIEAKPDQLLCTECGEILESRKKGRFIVYNPFFNGTSKCLDEFDYLGDKMADGSDDQGWDIKGGT